MKPTVGRVVHWVAAGHSLGANTSTSTCRAAIVTEVTDDTTISAAVFTTRGTLFYTDLTYDANNAGATWHWPELTSDTPTSSIFPAAAKPPTKIKKPSA